MTNQIRVSLEKEAYNKLKEQAKKFHLTLSQIATIMLTGYEISPIQASNAQNSGVLEEK